MINSWNKTERLVLQRRTALEVVRRFMYDLSRAPDNGYDHVLFSCIYLINDAATYILAFPCVAINEI